MDPTWGWFEWLWFAAGWTVPAIIVGKWWLLPRLKRRQWWALLAAPVLYVLTFVPMFMMCCKPYFGARAAGLTRECQSQLRALTRATYYFTSGNGDRMPVASTWQSDVAPFLKTTPGSKALRCPASRHERGYAFNVNLSGVALSKIAAPSETVLFFEGNGTSDYGGEELVASDLRHSGTLWVVTVDGSTHRYRPDGSRKLIWRLAPVKSEKGSAASPRRE